MRFVESLRRLVDGQDKLPTERDPKTPDEAIRRLESGKGGDRAIAAQDIARLFPEEAERELPQLFVDDDWRVRSVAITSWSYVAGRGGWETYAKGLEDPHLTAASSAWQALQRVSGPGDIAELLDLRERAHPKLRRHINARIKYLESRRSR